MSGTIEANLDKFVAKWIPKIPYLKELENHGERQIAGGHVTLMAMISLLPVALSAVTNFRWLCLLSFLSFYLIYNAEKPPVGRRIDWITRTAGWLIGSIFALIYLLK